MFVSFLYTRRCSWCVGGCGGWKEEEGEGVKGERRVFIHKSAEVASIARIPVNDIILGKSANDVRGFYLHVHIIRMILHTYMYLYVHIHSVCYVYTCI